MVSKSDRAWEGGAVADDGTGKKTGEKKCPICGKPTVEKYRPFCSKRCADVDLGRWFGGVYRIPSEEPVDPDDLPPEDPDD